MHGGFGGGHGGGGHGGGGHGHGGGGHGHATHATHSGHAHSQPIAAHNLGGQSQSVLGHMTSLVSNGQGVLGHIAGWLVGQHHGVMHHGAGQHDHVGDASWASAALQVDKSEKWHQKAIKMPGVHILAVFIVIAGWLVFLGMLRHGDAEHVARSPMPTQQEWRQELVGSNSADQQGSESDEQGAPAGTTFGGATSIFGSPRAGTESSALTYAQAPAQQSDPQSLQPMQQMQQPMQQYQPQQMQSPAFAPAAQQPAAGLGRRSFSARSQLGAEGLDSRGFHHKVVAER